MIGEEDEELLLALLTYSRYFKSKDDKELYELMRSLETVGGGYFNLKKTKKRRLKNEKRNINKKKTHKKGGGNSEENKINKILNESEFKEFFDQNEGLRDKFNKLDIDKKKFLIFYIYTRIVKGKNTLSDEKPDKIPTHDKLKFELFYDQNDVVNNSQFINVTLDDIKQALNEKIDNNEKKEELVELLSKHINGLNEDIEKKFWYYILSIESKNKLDLKFPDWASLHRSSDTKNKHLKQLIESLKNE